MRSRKEENALTALPVRERERERESKKTSNSDRARYCVCELWRDIVRVSLRVRKRENMFVRERDCGYVR